MTTNTSTSFEQKTENFPSIPGVTYRKFRGGSDFKAMAEIINADYQADGLKKTASAEELRSRFAHMEHLDTDKDLLFVEFKGQAVGFGRCWWASESNGDQLYNFTIFLLPAWRRDGIPLAMGNFFKVRLLEIAAQQPGRSTKYLQSWGVEKAEWYQKLMKQLGLAPVRYLIAMARSCSLPIEINPLPEGIEVRTATKIDEYRKILDADSEACADHFGFVPHSEEDLQRWLKKPTFNPSLWKVAWEGDQVVGMVLNFVDEEENQKFNRKRGYTEDISVRKPWRRQGIARSLLCQSIRMFQEMGMEETALGVDADNAHGALGFYENVGYKTTHRTVTYRSEIKQQNNLE